MSETFSQADLEPSPEERRAALHDRLDRGAATLAALAVGLVVGGMIALGACAAPFVFRLTPSPEAGYAMGAAFARFDRIAIGAACVLLGAEVLRTWLSRRTRRTISGRLRRFAGILFAGCTAYMGLAVSPRINELHVAGARRGEGEAGATLESIHRRAELIGRAEVALGIVLIGLHVFTVRGRRDDEDDDNEAPAVRPPGPASDDEASDGAA